MNFEKHSVTMKKDVYFTFICLEIADMGERKNFQKIWPNIAIDEAHFKVIGISTLASSRYTTLFLQKIYINPGFC